MDCFNLRYFLFLLLILLLLHPVLSDENHTVEITEPLNFEGEVDIEIIETYEIKYNDNIPYQSVEVNITGELMENQFIILEFEENETDRTMHAFEGVNFELTDIQRIETGYKIPINEPGKYHLVKLGTRSEWNYYTNDKGECQITLNPSEEHEKMENCELLTPIQTQIMLITSIIFSAVLMLYLSLIYLKPRYQKKKIIQENNKITSKVKKISNEQRRNKLLEKLLEADEKAVEGNFSQAKSLIKEIKHDLNQK